MVQELDEEMGIEDASALHIARGETEGVPVLGGKGVLLEQRLLYRLGDDRQEVGVFLAHGCTDLDVRLGARESTLRTPL